MYRFSAHLGSRGGVFRTTGLSPRSTTRMEIFRRFAFVVASHNLVSRRWNVLCLAFSMLGLRLGSNLNLCGVLPLVVEPSHLELVAYV